jgi:integrase
LTRFTLQDAQRAMRALPSDLEASTRAAYAKLLVRVMSLAVYPGGIIAHSPLPKGFVPKAGPDKAKGLPWPSEDAAGLACTTWPLDERMFFGVGAREGFRPGEAARLTWGDLSLDVGAVRLDVNKTDRPRAWALDSSVAAALRVWKGMRTDTAPEDRVFRGVAFANIARRYRDYLQRACHARPELLEDGPYGIPSEDTFRRVLSALTPDLLT